MLIIPILFYILGRLSAPTWCYVLLWIYAAIVIAQVGAGIYKVGKNSK